MADIKADLDEECLDIKLISTPMSRCTNEEKKELLEKNKELQKELEYIKNTTEKDMYINDLNELRNELSPDFK